MDFRIKNIWRLEIGGLEIWITQTIINTWILMLLLIAAAVVVRVKFRKFTEIPEKFQNVIEAIVEIFDNFLIDVVGEKLSYLGNWFFMVFVFILTSNLSGVLGFRPPTADWVTTFAFAFSTLLLIQIVGVKHRGMEYLQSFFKPNPIFFPLNVIGELARPISLSFRLFGNILSGLIIMTMLYTLAPIYVRVLIPVPLHAYFDVAIGALHTYIFCVLSMTFVGAASIPSDM